VRIGILCHPTFGGSGVVAAECALSLAQRGHRVHLFSPGVPPRLAGDAGGVVLHRVHGLDYPLFASSHDELAATGAVLDVIAAEGLDVLHAHYALPHAVSAHLACEAARATDANTAPRLVVTLHGTDVTLVAAAPAYGPLLRYVLGRADAVTAVSDDLSMRLRAWWGDAADEVQTLPNFVDTEHFTPRASRAPGPLRAIHVSNFRSLKRVPWLIEAFARAKLDAEHGSSVAALSASAPEQSATAGAELTLIGEGPDLPRCRALAAELGVEHAVHFLGERRELPALLAAHDAFLLTSREESFGLSALEASACGLGVLATRVGGLPEVIEDGSGGRLIDADDQDAFVRELRTWITDPQLACTHGRAGRERAVSSFGREAGVDRYEALYRRLLSR
jgi:L-malate glycosyltransferase